MGKYKITLTVSDKYTKEEKEQNFKEFERVLGEIAIEQYLRRKKADNGNDGENRK